MTDTMPGMAPKSARFSFVGPESLKAHFEAQAEAENTDLTYILLRALERQREADIEKERERG